MGKRKKLELKTQRRQKIRLSPSRSDDEISDDALEDSGFPETKFDSASSTAVVNKPASEGHDETLQCFLKEIKELEETANAETPCAVENGQESTCSKADNQTPAVLTSHDVVWSENFDDYYECYYYFNHITQESTWYKPTEGKIIPFNELSARSQPSEEAVEIVSQDVNIENFNSNPEIQEDDTVPQCVPEEKLEQNKPEPLPQVDNTDPQPHDNNSVDEELDSFLSSPSPEHLNVIINGGNLGSLASICNFGSFGNSSDSEDEKEINQNTIGKEDDNVGGDLTNFEKVGKEPALSEDKVPENEETLQENDKSVFVEDVESSVLIDIDEELESAVDKEHSENLMNNRMKVTMGMMMETLTSKFAIFELSCNEISPLIQLFIEYNLLKDLYEAKSLSLTDFVPRLCSICQKVTDFEKTVSANERCELRWCDSSKSYYYFDRLMDEKADIRPLLTNVKYDVLQSTKPNQVFSKDNSLEDVISEKSTCEVGTQVELHDPDMLQNPDPGIVEEGESNEPEIASAAQPDPDLVLIQPIEDQTDLNVDGDNIPDNLGETRNQVMEELNLPSDWNIDRMSEDPGLQYKLYKKVKRYAKEQSKNGLGNRQQIMESVWELLRLDPLVASPYDVRSPHSVEELRVSTPDNLTNSPQMSECFPSNYSILNSSSHKSSSINNTEINLALSPPPPPPPPVVETQSDDTNNGVVYCLPAPSVQNFSDSQPSVPSASPQQQPLTTEIKVLPKTTAIELIAPQPPKKKKVTETPKTKPVAATPVNKFKNKNMGKLVDKWKKVKDEIREEPDAVEGEFYFEPRSTDKWRDEQQKLQPKNPNLIEINESKNKLKIGKSKKHPFL